jgi:hypothetical protein
LTDFEALLRRGAVEVAVLYAFDLIELDGSDLRNLPIETRKATLASLLRNPGSIRLSEHFSANGPDVFVHACRLGAEGIVSKRLGSPYRSGRYSAWIKMRNPAGIAVQRRSGARIGISEDARQPGAGRWTEKLKETKMPDFNAKGDIYRVEFKSAAGHRPIAPSKPIRSGTVAEGVRWIMAKRPDDRKTYFMTVALEAGFVKSELRHPDIEAISRRADFPQA